LLHPAEAEPVGVTDRAEGVMLDDLVTVGGVAVPLPLRVPLAEKVCV